MANRISPYEYLRRMASEFADEVFHSTRRLMWTYPKDRLTHSWPLHQLTERVQAADQLDFFVELKATDNGLEVWYVKRAKRPTRF